MDHLDIFAQFLLNALLGLLPLRALLLDGGVEVRDDTIQVLFDRFQRPSPCAVHLLEFFLEAGGFVFYYPHQVPFCLLPNLNQPNPYLLLLVQHLIELCLNAMYLLYPLVVDSIVLFLRLPHSPLQAQEGLLGR